MLGVVKFGRYGPQFKSFSNYKCRLPVPHIMRIGLVWLG